MFTLGSKNKVADAKIGVKYDLCAKNGAEIRNGVRRKPEHTNTRTDTHTHTHTHTHGQDTGLRQGPTLWKGQG